MYLGLYVRLSVLKSIHISMDQCCVVSQQFTFDVECFGDALDLGGRRIEKLSKNSQKRGALTV